MNFDKDYEAMNFELHEGWQGPARCRRNSGAQR